MFVGERGWEKDCSEGLDMRLMFGKLELLRMGCSILLCGESSMLF